MRKLSDGVRHCVRICVENLWKCVRGGVKNYVRT